MGTVLDQVMLEVARHIVRHGSIVTHGGPGARPTHAELARGPQRLLALRLDEVRSEWGGDPSSPADRTQVHCEVDLHVGPRGTFCTVRLDETLAHLLASCSEHLEGTLLDGPTLELNL